MYYTTGVYPSCFDPIVFNGKVPFNVFHQGFFRKRMATRLVLLQPSPDTVTSIMTSNAGPITESPLATATGDAMQMGSGPVGGIIG